MVRKSWDRTALIGAGLVVAALAVDAAITHRNIRQLNDDARWVSHTHEVRERTSDVLQLAVDAVSYQRGYQLTGNEQSLASSRQARADLDAAIKDLQRLTEDNADQQQRILTLEQRVRGLLDVLARDESQTPIPAEVPAAAEFASETKLQLDAVRAAEAEIQNAETSLLSRRETDTNAAYRTAIASSLLTLLLGVTLFGGFVYFTQRSRRQIEDVSNLAQLERERLRVTLASIGDAVVATDTQGRVTFLNGVAEELTGWNSPDAAGRPLTDIFRIINETTRVTVENPVERTLREGVIVGLANHTVLIARDGVERPIADSAAPIRDASGRIMGTVLVFRDVTEQRDEERAREDRQRIRNLRADVGLALGQRLALPLALQQCAEAIIANLGVSYARIWILNPADQVLEAQGTAGLAGATDGPAERIPIGQFRIGKIAASRQPHLTNDVANDPDFSNPEWARRSDLVSFAGYPLLFEDRVVGAMALLSRQPLSESVLSDLASVTDSIAQHIELHRSETALVHGQEQFRGIFDQSVAGIAQTDLNGRFLEVNQRFRDIVGRTEAELRSTNKHDITHPEDRQASIERFESLVSGNGPDYVIEKRYLLPDGNSVWVNSSVSGIRDATGQIRSVAVVTVDITNRRWAEDLLKESEQRFRQLADVVPQIVWITRPDGHCEYFNRRWYEFTGLTPADSLGHLWSNALHPDDLQRTIDRWNQSLESGAIYQTEYRFRGADGQFRWYLARGLAIRDDAGAIVKWFGTSTDIDELKRSEEERITAQRASLKRSEQVRELAVIASHLNLAEDVKGVIDVVTSGAREIIGAHQCMTTRRGDPRGNGLATSVSFSEKYAAWREATIPSDNGIARLVCEANQPMRLTQGELEAHPAGREASQEVHRHPPMRGFLAAPLTDSLGRNIGLIQLSDRYEGDFTGDDEAVLVQLAQMASVAMANVRMYVDLIEADRRKDQFLATLAHELRNPLSPLTSAAQLLRMDPSNPSQTGELTEIISRQCEQLRRLIDDLLDVSRISTGKLSLQSEAVTLQDAIAGALDVSRPLIDASNHALNVGVPPEPLIVAGDKVRLSQIVGNLLVNAAKYTPSGGRIDLDLTREAHEAVIRIRDNGIGIPPEMLTKIFAMFTQVDSSHTRSQGGLGIGLTLVKTLVEMHGGHIEAASEGPGRGSEFTVRLPLIDTPTPASADRPSEPPPLPRLRILIVDDNRAASYLLGRLLERLQQQEVHVADSADLALNEIQSFQPDLVISDIAMPGISGYELATRIRGMANVRQPYLIALTGYGQESDREEARAAGFDRHLVKPVSLATLEQVLRSFPPVA